MFKHFLKAITPSCKTSVFFFFIQVVVGSERPDNVRRWQLGHLQAGEIGPKESCYDQLPKMIKNMKKNFFQMDQTYPAAFRNRVGTHFIPNLGVLAL